MHPEARQWVKDHVGSPSRVIEFGSLDVNGTLTDLFDCDYIGVDIVDGPNVDVLADAATVELPAADLVVCCELLEHVVSPRAVINNAWRLLRPGGRLIVTAAGLGRTPHGQHGADRPVDGEPYRNLADNVLEGLIILAGFTTWTVARGRGGADVYAVADK